MHSISKTIQMIGFSLGILLFNCAFSAEVPEKYTGAGVTSLSGGFCLFLIEKAEEADIAIKLSAEKLFLVQILSKNTDVIQDVRSRIEAAGFTGRVFAEKISSFHSLPYVDNLVNLAVLPGALQDTESMAELNRVLAPRGEILVKSIHMPSTSSKGKFPGSDFTRKGEWWRWVKPVPAGSAEWTHNRYDSSGNAVSADTVGNASELHWLGGPAWDQEVLAVVSAGGRNFYCTSQKAKKKTGKKNIVITARDAYNGLPLWEREWEGEYETEAYFPYQELPDEKPEWAGKIAKYSAGTSASRPGGNTLPFTAGKNCLYTVFEGKVSALDSATGKLLRTFDVSGDPRDIIFSGDYLLVGTPSEVLAFNPDSGKILWKAAYSSKDIVVDGDSLYFLDVGKKPANITALDLKSGVKKWNNDNPPWTKDLAEVKPPLDVLYLRFCKAGVLAVTGGRGIYVVSSKDGKALWSKQYGLRVSKFRYAAYSDAWLWGGLIWVFNHAEEAERKAEREQRGYDPLTGELKRTIPGNMPHCTRTVATEQMMISGHYCNFLSESGDFEIPAIRNACNLGVLPANNMLYGMPHFCNCKSWYLYGYHGFGMPGKVEKILYSERFEKGPAFERSFNKTVAEEGWLTYRHDAQRSSGTIEKLPENPKLLWSQKFPVNEDNLIANDGENISAANGPVSSVTAADGAVYIALPDKHQVVALVAASGKEKWRFTASARVRLPPTIHKGICLIGSQDGYVYAVDASDGALIWSLRGRAAERRIMAHGQIESMWPVVNVVAYGNKVYFTSGRSSEDPGGLKLCIVELLTGKIITEMNLNKYSALLDIPSLDKDGAFLSFPNMPGWELELSSLKENSLESVSAERIKNRFALAVNPLSNKAGAARGSLIDGTVWKVEKKVKGVTAWRYGASTGDMLAYNTDNTAVYFRGKGKNAEYTLKFIPSAGEKGKEVKLKNKLPPGALVVAGDKVLLAGTGGSGKYKGYISIYSALDGALIQSIDTAGGAMFDGVSVSDGRIFVSTKEGTLLCYGTVKK